MIKVLLFAHFRDIAGFDKIELPIGDMANVRDLRIALKPHVPIALIDELNSETAMVSVNHKYAGWDAPLSDGAEIGLLPPVSGG